MKNGLFYTDGDKIVKVQAINIKSIKGFDLLTEKLVFESSAKYKELSIELVKAFMSERVRTTLALDLTRTIGDASALIGIGERTFYRVIKKHIG